ncbi:unnamed protein product, partial [Brenthis ino]
MKIIVLLSFFAYIEARVVNENCNGVVVHNINHQQEILKDDVTSPYQLAIDYDTNNLFFSYSTGEIKTLFESAYINLKTNEFQIIEGINGGFANAVDNKANVVYLGGNDGIYKFDYNTKIATHIDGTSHNIWQMFFKNELYYSTYPEEHVYVYKDNHSQRVSQLVDTRGMLVALDNDDNIYFSNSTGLFIYKKVKDYTFYLGDYNLNAITSDINGNLFFSTPSGIYSIDSDSKKIENLASIENIYGVAVESDGNIIYASDRSVIRLKPTKTKCVN